MSNFLKYVNPTDFRSSAQQMTSQMSSMLSTSLNTPCEVNYKENQNGSYFNAIHTRTQTQIGHVSIHSMGTAYRSNTAIGPEHVKSDINDQGCKLTTFLNSENTSQMKSSLVNGYSTPVTPLKQVTASFISSYNINAPDFTRTNSYAHFPGNRNKYYLIGGNLNIINLSGEIYIKNNNEIIETLYYETNIDISKNIDAKQIFNIDITKYDDTTTFNILFILCVNYFITKIMYNLMNKNNENESYGKYLKYKMKYLELKNKYSL